MSYVCTVHIRLTVLPHPKQISKKAIITFTGGLRPTPFVTSDRGSQPGLFPSKAAKAPHNHRIRFGASDQRLAILVRFLLAGILDFFVFLGKRSGAATGRISRWAPKLAPWSGEGGRKGARERGTFNYRRLRRAVGRVKKCLGKLEQEGGRAGGSGVGGSGPASLSLPLRASCSRPPFLVHNDHARTRISHNAFSAGHKK